MPQSFREKLTPMARRALIFCTTSAISVARMLSVNSSFRRVGSAPVLLSVPATLSTNPGWLPSYNPFMTHHFDICIRGGGIVAHALALLLARERLRVGLCVPQATSQGEPDVRAYALNAKSKALLESVRCWPDAVHATPVMDMQVKGDEGGDSQFFSGRTGGARADLDRGCAHAGGPVA